MIPFTNEHSGLRDFRAHVTRDLAPRRWPWTVLAFVLGLLLGTLR